MKDISEILVPGKTYDVALLSVDAEQHLAQSRNYESAPFAEFMDQFHAYIGEIVQSCGGSEWSFAGDGGLWFFVGDSCCQDAAMAGMRIINTWQLLGIDVSRNPLNIALRLRVAASAGPMIYRDPRETVMADCIGRSVHLQEDATDPNEFTIDESILSQLPNQHLETFRFKELLDSRRVFRYLPQVPGRRPADAEVEGLITRAKQRVTEILDNHVPREPIVVGNEDVSQLLEKSGKVYDDVVQFCRWFLRPEEIWSERFYWQIAAYASQLAQIEGRLWKALHGWLDSLTPVDVRLSGLLPLQKRIASLHGSVVETDLANLKKEYELRARDSSYEEPRTVVSRDRATAELRTPRDDLMKLVRRFVSVDDDMESLASFIPIVSYPREELHVALENGSFPEHGELVRRLGSQPDLVLTEDLARGLRPGEDGGLFCVLRRSREMGKLFDVLAGLLDRNDLHPFEEELHRLFKSRGHSLTKPEIAGIQRALVVAHPNLGIRYRAVTAANREELWNSVAYENTPLLALSVLARRLPDWKDDSLKRIFFDCVRDRLLTAIRGLGSPQEIRIVEEFLSVFFHFDCFAASSYFYPLAEMVTCLDQKAQELADVTGLSGWAELFQKHRSGTYPDDPRPPQVGLLPLVVQQYLARLGRYPLMFACSSHHHVANEIAEYVHPGNISLFLREGQLNRPLFAKLLRRQELFSEEEPLLLALTHPRCHPGYAAPHLKRLNMQQMDYVLRHRSANLDVKTKALKIHFSK